MILAGGRGTRVRPLTDAVPKPMIPIVNRPVMEFLVDLLRRHGGVVTEAAAAAGLDRTHVYRLLRKHRLTTR
jgi:NDP-sugar pyrophosphorylase family protein